MDGVLIVHARTGHVLFSKAYTEGYGLDIAGGDDDPNSPSKKDPMVASMLLANFICAFYTNVVNLVDESLLSPSSLQSLLRSPLSSFSPGSCSSSGGSPSVFFHRDLEKQVICTVFLKKEVDGGFEEHENESSGKSEEDGDSSSFSTAGDWLVRSILDSFLHTYSAELAAKPFRASTKTFKPFLKQVEEIYTTQFSQRLLQTTLHRITQQLQPSWMYLVYSEKFTEGMDRIGGEVNQPQQNGRANPGKGSRKVADESAAAASSLDQQVTAILPSPSFVPHPPSTPNPNSVIAASAASSSTGSSHQSYFAARPITTKQKHPFLPPKRRWWHFGSSKEPIPIFYSKLGRTTCLYNLGAGWKGDKSEEKEPDPSILSSLPSSDAIHKLVAVIHNAGRILAQPTEMQGEKMKSMEMTLQAAAAGNKSKDGGVGASPPIKLWILRVQDLILCFPTGGPRSDPSAAIPVASYSLPQLLSALHPCFSALESHYAFVDEIHERNYRQLQKNMEKQAAAAPAGKANAK